MSSTIYGAAVALIKNKQIYLFRRTEKVLFPKKWSFISARLRNTEQSMDTAARIITEQSSLKIDKRRLFFATNVTVEESNEFYYVYIVNLNNDEIPLNTCDRWRGDWRIFPLDKASVLDLVPGIRPIIRGLHRSLVKIETVESKPIIGPLPQQKQESTKEHIRQQLSQGEQLHLSKLGAKMTRHSQYPDGDSFGL